MIVAIEGVDGSGKTTQAHTLVTRLSQEGQKVAYVQPIFFLMTLLHVPPSLQMLMSPRSLTTQQKDTSQRRRIITLFAVAFGTLYALVTYSILRINFSKKIVVCDRYFYQFFYDLFPIKAVSIATIFPRPDITFILEGEPKILYSRMTDSGDKKVAPEYYASVSEYYQKIADSLHFIRIDSSQDRETIHNALFSSVMKRLKEES